jgi:hypothetical protein
VDENIVAYCSLDEGGRRPTKELSLKEKEELFLEAMLVRLRRLKICVWSILVKALFFSGVRPGACRELGPALLTARCGTR